MNAVLEIRDLHVMSDGKKILKGIDLKIRQGEIHAIMGPNGAGKSTLVQAIMGHPRYKIEKGEILFDEKNIRGLSTDKRARLGLFLGFQYPPEISGVKVTNFLRTAHTALNNGNGKQQETLLQFHERIKGKMKPLKMSPEFINRFVNEGFSGGEKKRCEILQLAVLTPKIALLDEIDSGLDVDALKVVAGCINTVRKQTGILLITHYQRILQYVAPNFVHVLIDGRIVRSGKADLAHELEQKGYTFLKGGADNGD